MMSLTNEQQIAKERLIRQYWTPPGMPDGVAYQIGQTIWDRHFNAGNMKWVPAGKRRSHWKCKRVRF